MDFSNDTKALVAAQLVAAHVGADQRVAGMADDTRKAHCLALFQQYRQAITLYQQVP